MSPGRRVVAPLAAVAFFAAGCARILGADFDDAKPLATAPDDAARCRPAGPPPPPDVVGAGGDVDLTVVVREVDYGDDDEERARNLGYDLDGECTPRGGPGSCDPFDWAPGENADGIDGRDNSLGRVLAMQADVLGLAAVSSERINEQVAAGTLGPVGILRVRGYDGEPDDDEVKVDWFVPLAPSAAPVPFVPKFDGTDAWPVAAAWVAGASGGDAGTEAASVLRAETAYVSQRRLVALFNSVVYILAAVPVETVDVIVTGDLVRDPKTARWSLVNGVTAAKVPIDAMLGALPQLTRAASGVALCTDTVAYPDVKKFLCAAADVAVSPAATSCDAASIGTLFQGSPTRIGDVQELPSVEVCEPPVDPVNDTCAVAPGR